MPGSNMSYTLPSGSTGGTGQSQRYRRLCPKWLCMADPIVHRTSGNERPSCWPGEHLRVAFIMREGYYFL